jgi:predicted nucleic acid-binding protein
MRVFLDTNVVVSAFATRGLAADARIRGEALAARADVLVTGDKDLLDVAGKVPLPILTPRGFWTLLRDERERG